MPKETRSRVKPAPDPVEDEAPHVCTVAFCPICFAVAALQPLRPDAVEHLMNAGREFLMAVKSVLDQRAADAAGDDRTRLERIDIA